MAAATGRFVETSTSSSDSPDDESSINRFSIFDMICYVLRSLPSIERRIILAETSSL